MVGTFAFAVISLLCAISRVYDVDVWEILNRAAFFTCPECDSEIPVVVRIRCKSNRHPWKIAWSCWRARETSSGLLVFSWSPSSAKVMIMLLFVEFMMQLDLGFLIVSWGLVISGHTLFLSFVFSLNGYHFTSLTFSVEVAVKVIILSQW